MRIDFFWKKECAGGTLLMRKDILTEKTIKDHQDFFKGILRSCFELFEMFFEVKNLHFLPASSVR